MSQTGTIYGYHDGNTYSLANVYDEKASELEFDTLSNSGLSSDCITARVVLFDTETGILNSWYKGEIATTSQLATIFYDKGRKNDGLSFISNENAQFDYALHFDKARPTCLRVFGNIDVSTVVNSKNAWTIDCWYYVDTTAESDTGIIFATGRASKAVKDGNYDAKTYSYKVLTFSYSYTATTAEIFFGTSRPTTWTYVRELDRSVFNAPFHLAIIGSEAGQHNRIYVNGELYCYETSTATTSTLQIYGFNTLYFGTGVTYSSKYYTFGASNIYYNGALSEFRLTFGARYHDNFTPQSFQGKVVYVPANMLIRHADANHYIPLTTSAANTSAPYIAVRHGNTNYYAIK